MNVENMQSYKMTEQISGTPLLLLHFIASFQTGMGQTDRRSERQTHGRTVDVRSLMWLAMAGRIIIKRQTFCYLLAKARSTLATMSKQHCRSNRHLCCLLLRQCCRFGHQCRSNVRLCRKDEISTQNSFDIVAVLSNKVERCFHIVAKNGNNVEATS